MRCAAPSDVPGSVVEGSRCSAWDSQEFSLTGISSQTGGSPTAGPFDYWNVAVKGKPGDSVGRYGYEIATLRSQ